MSALEVGLFRHRAGDIHAFARAVEARFVRQSQWVRAPKPAFGELDAPSAGGFVREFLLRNLRTGDHQAERVQRHTNGEIPNAAVVNSVTKHVRVIHQSVIDRGHVKKVSNDARLDRFRAQFEGPRRLENAERQNTFLLDSECGCLHFADSDSLPDRKPDHSGRGHQQSARMLRRITHLNARCNDVFGQLIERARKHQVQRRRTKHLPPKMDLHALFLLFFLFVPVAHVLALQDINVITFGHIEENGEETGFGDSDRQLAVVCEAVVGHAETGSFDGLNLRLDFVHLQLDHVFRLEESIRMLKLHPGSAMQEGRGIASKVVHVHALWKFVHADVNRIAGVQSHGPSLPLGIGDAHRGYFHLRGQGVERNLRAKPAGERPRPRRLRFDVHFVRRRVKTPGADAFPFNLGDGHGLRNQGREFAQLSLRDLQAHKVMAIGHACVE